MSCAHLLDDPGLVMNAHDSTHCFQACLSMVLRTGQDVLVPDFEALDAVLGTIEGKWSWQFAGLDYLAAAGFEIIVIEEFCIKRFVAQPLEYMKDYYGAEVAAEQQRHSDVAQAVIDAQRFLVRQNVKVENRVPDVEDIRHLVEQGFYLICGINQRVLQCDDGYVGHSVLIFGTSERGVRFHNPGPPATRASEIPWTLFERAWSYPTARANNIYAARWRSE